MEISGNRTSPSSVSVKLPASTRHAHTSFQRECGTEAAGRHGRPPSELSICLMVLDTQAAR